MVYCMHWWLAVFVIEFTSFTTRHCSVSAQCVHTTQAPKGRGLPERNATTDYWVEAAVLILYLRVELPALGACPGVQGKDPAKGRAVEKRVLVHQRADLQ